MKAGDKLNNGHFTLNIHDVEFDKLGDVRISYSMDDNRREIGSDKENMSIERFVEEFEGFL